MSIDAVSNHTAASASAALQYGNPAGLSALENRKNASTPSPADIKKAAAQFEAIIMRQLLAPSIEPIMSGGMGGSGGVSSGGGVYGHMLTEVLADNLAQGGGLGLGRLLEKQLGGKSAASAPLSSNALLKPSTSSTESL